MPKFLTDEQMKALEENQNSGFISDEKMEVHDAQMENLKNPSFKNAAARLGESYERYFTAPIRAGVSKAVEGGFTQPILENFTSGFSEQFGKPPTAAPSGAEQIEKVTGKKLSDRPLRTFQTGVDERGNPKYFPEITPRGALGFAAETMQDPMTYADAPIKWMGEAAKDAARFGTKVVAKSVSDIPFAHAERYMARPKEVKSALGIEDIRAKMIDELHGPEGIISTRDQMSRDLESATKGTKEAYKGKMRELELQTVPKTEAQNIQAALTNQKEVLGSLGEQADDALVRSGKTFKKKDLLSAIDETGKSLGEYAIGETQVAAIKKLTDLRERIDSLPNDLPATAIRDIMRQLRTDVDYGLRSGEFNSVSNSALKNITANMSKALKDVSPEYAAYMDRMQKLAKNLEELNIHFGDESRSLGSLSAMAKRDSTRGYMARKALKEYAELTNDRDLLGKVESTLSSRQSLEEMRRGYDPKKYSPSEYAAEQEQAANLATAESIGLPKAKLKPENIQSLLENIVRKKPNISQKDLVQELERMTGTPYSELMQDYAARESFSKDATRGSRNTILGGMIGGWATGGNPAGIAVGGALGHQADKYAGKAIQAGIDTAQQISSKIDSVWTRLPDRLKRVINSTAKSGTKITVVHHLLMNTDPEYRSIIEGNEQ